MNTHSQPPLSRGSRAITGVLALVMVTALGLVPATGEAAARKRRNAGPAKVKVDKGSGETTRERERRLLRECKGRPNAGACEGFAS